MPARYEIDVEREVVFVFYAGVVTLDEVRSTIMTALTDPRVRPHFGILADCADVTETLAFDETVDLVEYYRNSNIPPRTGRSAFYVLRRDAVYGALRQFQAMAGRDGRIRVFTDLNEARAWVGLPAA